MFSTVCVLFAGKNKENAVDDRTNLDEAFVISNSITAGLLDVCCRHTNNNTHILLAGTVSKTCA